MPTNPEQLAIATQHGKLSTETWEMCASPQNMRPDTSGILNTATVLIHSSTIAGGMPIQNEAGMAVYNA